MAKWPAGLRRRWRRLLEHRDDPRMVRAARAGIGLLTALLLALTVCTPFLPKQLKLEVGSVAPRTIYADRQVSYEDDLEWERRKEEARRRTDPVYDAVHDQARDRMLSRTVQMFYAVPTAEEGPPATPATQTPSSGTPPADWRLEQFRSRMPQDVIVSEKTLRSLLAVPENRLLDLQAACEQVVEWEAREDSRSDVPDDRQAALLRMRTHVFSLPGLSEEEKSIVNAVCAAVWEPTKILNYSLTEEAQRKAAEAVPKPPDRVIRKGQRIVAMGAVVDQRAVRDLQELGLLQPAVEWSTIIYASVFLFGALLLGSHFLRQFTPTTYGNTRRLMVVAGLLVGGAIVMNLATRKAAVSPYLFLVATQVVALVISTLFETIGGVMTVALLAIIAGILAGNSLFATTLSFVGGCLAVMQSARLSHRPSALFRFGVSLGVLNFAVLLLSHGVFKSVYLDEPRDLAVAMAWCLSTGVAATLLGYFLIRWLEAPLGIVTEMRLLELSSPHEPLLHRLLTEAPGTYNASFLISNLAGNAAEAIAANSLLVRVGALYHDIGKLARPYFFAENQFGGHNPLQDMSPALAALVVIAHVKKGLELGRKAGLPQPILDLIAQHHGTSVVGYFYELAAKEQGKDNVPKDRYRYPGPKPQSKEAAVLMLADAAEAAVRTIKEPTAGKIEAMVRHILAEKLDQGQFDECPITLRELHAVADSLCRSFHGIYHTRVQYPSSRELVEELGGRKEERAAQG